MSSQYKIIADALDDTDDDKIVDIIQDYFEDDGELVSSIYYSPRVYNYRLNQSHDSLKDVLDHYKIHSECAIDYHFDEYRNMIRVVFYFSKMPVDDTKKYTEEEFEYMDVDSDIIYRMDFVYKFLENYDISIHEIFKFSLVIKYDEINIYDTSGEKVLDLSVDYMADKLDLSDQEVTTIAL